MSEGPPQKRALERRQAHGLRGAQGEAQTEVGETGEPVACRPGTRKHERSLKEAAENRVFPRSVQSAILFQKRCQVIVEGAREIASFAPGARAPPAFARPLSRVSVSCWPSRSFKRRSSSSLSCADIGSSDAPLLCWLESSLSVPLLLERRQLHSSAKP